MSDDCCGADEPRPTATRPQPVVLRPTPPPCACCAPDDAGTDTSTALPVTVVTRERPVVLRPTPAPCACCAPVDTRAAQPPTVADDGCCDPAVATPTSTTRWYRDTALLPSAVAGVTLLLGYGLQWSGLPTASLVLLGAALIAGASTFVPGALRRLARRRLGVGLLMTIAAVGAVLLGHVGEAATLAFLFSLAEALEDRAMSRAKDGLRALLTLIPDTARVSRPTGDVTVPAAQVRAADLLVVGAGERVPTDGVVSEGSSSLDTSAVTGESIPVDVGPGDPAPAGSVNGAGTLRIEATADGTDNSLTQIVALVEQAHARKGERARLADRIARPLVPGVLVAAALVALVGVVVGDTATWVERALVVLVAASPCAMALAVPVTVISAIGAAAKHGLVVKSGAAFEQLGRIRTVALDKTGTLTRNEPAVVDVRTAPGVTREGLLGWAAAVEAHSTHPLAVAVTAAAPTAPPAADVVEQAGLGVTGLVGERLVRVGNARWLDAGPLAADAADLAARGMTAVVVHADGRTAGLIGIRDELRPEAAETVRLLHEQGIDTIMLTGDDHRTAHALAQQAGIDDVRAEQLPADKAAAVTALAAGRAVAMVGDGINDAPALAAATVGVAMGLSGSAAAVESADVAFTGHDLRLLPLALAHARRGRRIMTANIGLALAIVVVLVPLALLGVLGLAGVVLVHEVAEVVVILNGVRAARRPAALRRVAPAPRQEPVRSAP